MDKALIKKYFQNVCTLDEVREVESFLSLPEAHDIVEELLDEEWTSIGEPLLDESVRNSYKSRFLEERARFAEKKIRHLQHKRLLIYAASILVVMGFSFYIFSLNIFNNASSVKLVERTTLNGERALLILPDSSLVHLGPGSKVTYPERFAGETREIHLEGEAFFEVEKDPSHAFIIHSGTVSTRVLGTSFKVTAMKGYDITVGVATGKVSVNRASTATSGPEKQLAILEPGEQVRYNEATEKLETGQISIADLEGWKSGNMFFSAESLETVITILERSYNVHINIHDQYLRDFEVNASFNADEPIEKVLRVLGVTAGFDFVKEGNKITINVKKEK